VCHFYGVPKPVILEADVKLPVASIDITTVAPYLNCNTPPDSVIVKLVVLKFVAATFVAFTVVALTVVVFAVVTFAVVPLNVVAFEVVAVTLADVSVFVMVALLPSKKEVAVTLVVPVTLTAVMLPYALKSPAAPDNPFTKLVPSQ
jgi:hypothetical protein